MTEKGKKTKKKEEKKQERPEEPVEPVSVEELVRAMIVNLEMKAWAYLGIVVHPETQSQKEDIREAKIAIDTMDSLLNIARRWLSEEEIKKVELSLSNLRLNFVSKSKK